MVALLLVVPIYIVGGHALNCCYFVWTCLLQCCVVSFNVVLSSFNEFPAVIRYDRLHSIVGTPAVLLDEPKRTLLGRFRKQHHL